MNNIQCIIAATDFSLHAGFAVDRAALLARASGAELGLLHVIGRLPLEALKRIFSEHPLETEQKLVEAARGEMARMAEELHAKHDIATSAHVGIGSAPAEIAAYAERMSAGLVVVGAHGENFLQEILMGTTVERTVCEGRGPFLVVKREPQRDYGRILVPVDFSPSSAAALELALRFSPGVDIHVLHAYDVPFEGKMRYSGVTDETFAHYQDLAHRDAESGMRDFMRAFPESDNLVMKSVKYGYAPAVIARCARDYDVDLVVMGGQGRSYLSLTLLGSVALHVMREFNGDVLVVKSTTQ